MANQLPSFSSKYNDYLVGETGRGASMYVSTGCLTWKFTKVNRCCDCVFIAIFLCFVCHIKKSWYFILNIWVSKSTCGTTCTTNESPLTLVRHAHVILRLAFSRQYFLIPIIDIPSSIPNSKANLKSLMLRKKYRHTLKKKMLEPPGNLPAFYFNFFKTSLHQNPIVYRCLSILDR